MHTSIPPIEKDRAATLAGLDDVIAVLETAVAALPRIVTAQERRLLVSAKQDRRDFLAGKMHHSSIGLTWLWANGDWASYIEHVRARIAMQQARSLGRAA